MKKGMDKLRSKIKTNKKFTIFLFVLLLVGVITGALFVTILSSSDKTLIKDYLIQYINRLKTENPDYLGIFVNSFFNVGITAFSIWLLGISIVGIPIMLFLFFSKTFLLGFSLSSLLYVYHGKGLVFAFCYLFPHQLIHLLAYSILLMYALSVSIKMIEAVLKHKTIDFKAIMGKYSVILGVTLVLFLIGSLSETFLMPHMLKWIATIV